MGSTKQGGQNAAKLLKAKYGDDYYKKIGAKGGKLGHTGGFYHRKYVLNDTAFISEQATKGGSKGRRGKPKDSDATSRANT